MPLLRTIKKLFGPNGAIVLMYHRVGRIDIDPWELSVTPKHFEEHLQVLRRNYDVISVSELVSQLHHGGIGRNAVCITFDDGYQDNFVNALPLLKRYECPATFYIATGFINTKKIFWWDLLTQIFLVKRKLPGALEVGELNFTLENRGEMSETDLAKHRRWKWPEPAPTQRCAIYLAVWEHLKLMPTIQISEVISFLTEWSGITGQSCEEDVAMTTGQLAEIASGNLFSIGVHTINHPAVGSQPAAIQYEELTVSRNFLYEQFDRYTDTVAYPYGHYNQETLDIMKNENFQAGFTTEEKLVNNKSDIYRLGRFQVKNQTGAELNRQMLKWKTK